MNLGMLTKILKFYGRFLPSFSAIGYRARRPFWGKLAADFHGQNWLVTGASGGIGRAIVLEAVARGATVLAVARSEEKLQQLKEEAGPNGERVLPLVADLSLVEQTQALVAQLAERGQAIDVLVNNVGALVHQHTLTSEGREFSYALNILNHYVLTEGLIAAELLRPGATVINMSSGGMYNAPLMVDKMNVTDPKRYSGVFAYAVHKRGQSALTAYWQERYGARDYRFYCMHPGWTDTEGVQTAMPRFRRILRLVLRNGAQGGDTAIWLAAKRPEADPEAFWFDRKARTAHVFPATRNSRFTPENLAEHLQADAGASA